MKILFIFTTLLFFTSSSAAQWVKQTVDTTASLRGLSVVNEKVVWASGTGGTVIRTADGGKTWKVMTVPGPEKLDFRDIEAFDANIAYILSIGNGESSRIYKTTDGGVTWKEQFRNKNEKAFFDAIACLTEKYCIAMSDPVDGKFFIIATTNGGSSWHEDNDNMPPAKAGEAAFAASGTCLLFLGQGEDSYLMFLVSGGSDARVFRARNTVDSGYSWRVTDTPMTKGGGGKGIFSIAVYDQKHAVIVGGNYEKPSEAANNLAFSNDNGATWTLGTGLTGYRSGVTYVDKNTLVAVGTNGSDMSRDGGNTWKVLGKEDLNAVQAKGKRAVWAVGPKGMVVKMK